jgi:hypothetical protein
MVTILLAFVSIIAFRFRIRAALELKVVALQNQLAVLRRQQPCPYRKSNPEVLMMQTSEVRDGYDATTA